MMLKLFLLHYWKNKRIYKDNNTMILIIFSKLYYFDNVIHCQQLKYNK